MKNLMVIGTLLFSLGAHADSGRTLKQVMSDMGGKFGRLAQIVNDASQNATSLELVRSLNVDIKDTLNLVPDSIVRSPNEKQRELQVQYDRLVSQMLLVDLDMEDALLAGRNADAVTLLNKMADLRRAGHTLFRTQ